MVEDEGIDLEDVGVRLNRMRYRLQEPESACILHDTMWMDASLCIIRRGAAEEGSIRISTRGS